jgi:hypothetical protein
MCAVKGSSRSPHYTKAKRNPVGSGSSDFKNRAVSRERGPSVYKFETWDCEAESHYLDKLKSLR